MSEILKWCTMYYSPSKKRAYRRVLLLKNKAFSHLHKSPIVRASKFRVFWKLSDYQTTFRHSLLYLLSELINFN